MQQKGRLISFMSAQSGNGASMADAHAAWALVNERHAKVLVADLDFHSGATADRLRLEPRGTWAELVGVDPASGSCRQANSSYAGIDLLLPTASANVIGFRGFPPIEAVLEAAAPTYDVVIADLPSALSTSARAVVARPDRIYPFCTPEPTSLHLVKRRMSELTSAGIDVSRVAIMLPCIAPHPLLDTTDGKKVLGRPVELQIPNDYLAASQAKPKRKGVWPVLADSLQER